MLPAFKEGDFVLVNNWFNKLNINDVVILKLDKYLIKRITKINNNKYFVEGDNKKESKKLLPVTKKDIVGKVIKKII